MAKRLLTVGLLAVGLGGCAMALRAPLTGFLYTSTKTGETATSNASGGATGEACAISILGFVAIGDASVEAAAQKAGIDSIASVDSTQTGILGVYAEHCTVVHGAAGSGSAPAAMPSAPEAAPEAPAE